MAEVFQPTFLVERPQSQRFWVVRASGGTYVQHFRKAGLMAIGHLDGIPMSEGPVGTLTASDVEKALAGVNKERSRNSITSHARQAEAFCSSIRPDDLVVTLDSQHLMVGRVVGRTAYVDREPVELQTAEGLSYKMSHRLRREISWGPLIRRNELPVAMEMTLLAHQTVFNIDRYWSAVYHLLYPCFTFEGKLYLSTNIQQQEDLDNYYITQLFGLLSGVEVMAKLLAQESESWEGYPGNLTQLRGPLSLSLSSKAEFMSPGTVWSVLAGEGTTIVWAAVLYVMVFGGDLKFFKADGIVDTHTRQKIWARVLKLIEAHDFEALKGRLKVGVPKVDTTPLQVEAQTKKRTRRKAAVVLEDGDGPNGSS